MFRRVAACGIAAFALVSPAVSSGETNVFADVNAPVASILVATTRDHAQDQIPAQVQHWTNGTQTQVMVSALNPAERSISSTAAAGPAPSPVLTEPFDLITVPVAKGDVLTKWSGVEVDIRGENDILSRCRASAERCPAAARRFLAVVEQGQAQTGRARIGIINRAINLAIRPMSDLTQWGVIDRWSAPLVTLATGFGDCEDYAIAKYVALTEAGVAAEDVKLVIVRDLAVGGEHAVVAVRVDGRWIILDNRWLTLVEDSQIRQIIPLFVLDQSGVRKFARTNAADVHRVSTSSEASASALGSL
jgi:predicted transglutaminase-like cysteine proteinase